MIFFFKRKKIIVDAFTSDAAVHKFASIKKASHFIPEWWKNLPPTVDGDISGIPTKVSTMKKCTGMINLLNKGFIIPTFSEVVIKVHKEGYWQYTSSHETSFAKNSAHDPVQYGFNFQDYLSFKIEMPWIVKEKTGVNFVASPTTWSYSEHWSNLTVVNGIVNFKYQNWCNVNSFLRKDDYVLTLDANQPLLQMIPMSEDDIELKTHLVSDEEYKRLYTIAGYQVSTIDRYNNVKKLIDKEEKVCPFRAMIDKYK